MFRVDQQNKHIKPRTANLPFPWTRPKPVLFFQDPATAKSKGHFSTGVESLSWPFLKASQVVSGQLSHDFLP